MSASATDMQERIARERAARIAYMEVRARGGSTQEANGARVAVLDPGVPVGDFDGASMTLVEGPLLAVAAGGAVPPPVPPVSVGGVPDGSTGPSGPGESVGGAVRLVGSAAEEDDPRPHRKVALVGYTTSKEEAPWGVDGWEIWCMNNLHGQLTPEQMKSVTRWYQLHSEADIAADEAHAAWLREEHPFPVFMIDSMEGLTHAPDGSEIPSLAERTGRPSAVAFPRQLILTHFMRYFTNTVSWQIAHALFESLYDESYIFTNLGLYGIDMAVSEEYAAQRPSVEFFLGLSNGLGIELHIPTSSDLLKAVELYGGEEDNTGFRAKCDTRLKELHAQKDHIEQQVAQAQQMHASICGAIDTFAYIQSVWLPPKTAGRDEVRTPRGALSAVAQMIAEGEQRERRAPEQEKQ